MRIIICEPSGHGKLSHYSRRLSEALLKQGHQALLITADDYELPAAADLRIERFFPARRLTLSELFRFSRLVQEWEADILHFQWLPSAAFITFILRFRRRWRAKLLFTAHNVLPHQRRFYETFFYRRLYRQVDKIVAHSEVDKEAIIKLSGVAADKIAVLPVGAGLAPTGVDKSEALRRLEVPAAGKVILFFGYVSPEKGPRVLLRAFKRLTKEHPQALLVIAGKAENKSEVERWVGELDLSARTRLDLRYIPGREAGYYLRAADILVLPYLKANQSPLIPLAYAYGLPVVATRGQIETVLDGRTGYLTAPGDEVELAAALSTLLSEDKKRAAMSAAALKLAADKYSWQSIARRTVKMYASLF